MSFRIGEIIIRLDRHFPDGIMVVDGYDRDGALLAHHHGNVFPRRIQPLEVAQFRLVTLAEQKASEYRSSAFTLEGSDEEYRGWTQWAFWKGWALPHFEFQEAERIIARLHDLGAHYSRQSDAFIFKPSSGTPHVWKARVIRVRGGKKLRVYPIGAFSWCWEEVPQN